MEITGMRRTSRDFVDRLWRMSSSTADVMDRLRRLRIFSTVTETERGVAVTEERCSIRFSGDTTKETPRGYFRLRLPNLLGGAENVEVSLSTSRDMDFVATKPVLWRGMGIFSIRGSKDVKKSPSEEYPHTRMSVGLDTDRTKMSAGREKIGYVVQTFLEMEKAFSFFSLKVKAGAVDLKTSKMFLKTQLDGLIHKRFSRVFASLSFSTGMVFGDSHATERYSLGGAVRGYKDMSISPTRSGVKVGGKSFFELTQKIGVCIGDASAFAFGSVGCVSEEIGLVETFRSAVHKDSECLGMSVGVGASIPVMKAKDGPVVGMSLAFPLAENRQIQRLQFGFDMDF